MKKIILFTSFALLFLTNAFAETTIQSPASLLGYNFGEIITLEGQLAPEGKSKSDLGKTYFIVKKVNGKPLKEESMIQVEGYALNNLKTFQGRPSLKIKGYESGRYEGIPEAAFQDLPMMSTSTFHWKSIFEVIKIIL